MYRPDKSPRKNFLSKSIFLVFILFMGLPDGINSKQIQSLGIKNSYITTLKYFGLVYKDRVVQRWYISTYGYRFIQGAIPCATSITVYNGETTDELNKQYFIDLFTKYVIEDQD